MAEVPELRGVVRDRHVVPGLSRGIDSPVFHTHELIAGCDLHAAVFPSPAGNIVVYQRSSTMHVEMPRPFNPKLLSISRMIGRSHPTTVIDGCSGVGTLGIAASLAGMPHVILNDRWSAAAFWSAVNISVNCRPLGLDDFSWQTDPAEFPKKRSAVVRWRWPPLPAVMQGLRSGTGIFGVFREKLRSLLIHSASLIRLRKRIGRVWKRS